MNSRYITISVGLLLFIILFLVLSHISYSKVVGILHQTPIIQEGWKNWRPPIRRWFTPQPARRPNAPPPPPPPPPNYAAQIKQNLSAVEATIKIINSKINVFNSNISAGTAVKTTATKTGVSIEELNINLNTDPIEQINKSLTSYIQVNNSNKNYYVNMVNVLAPQVSSIRQMSTYDYNAYARSGNIFNVSIQYINQLNSLSPSNTSPKMIFETKILKVLSTNYGLENGDDIIEIVEQECKGVDNMYRQTIEGLDVTPSTVTETANIVEKNIKLFADNGIVIDPTLFDKVNDELNKFIKESVGTSTFTKCIFIKQCATPLTKNNISTSAILVETINKLSKYGYNKEKSIFFYLRKFNALNIILNTPEYNALLEKYDKYGKITNLETFLNKCFELKIMENADGTQTKFSYNYFMIKHNEFGIDSNARLVDYVNKLKGFYTALNKEKYMLFLDCVNSFHLANTTKNINTSNNKLNEFIKTLQDAGINTYEEYTSVFKYENNESTQIQTGDIIVKLTSMDVYTFIEAFKRYYNQYRHLPDQQTQQNTTDETTTNDNSKPKPYSAIFAEKYPAINENTIPTVSLTQSISIFLTTFRALQFSQNGCFGYFIQSLLNGPKYMLNLLDINPVDNNNPVLYNFYVQTVKNGFTIMNSDDESYYDLFHYHSMVTPLYKIIEHLNKSFLLVPVFSQKIISPFTQIFSNTYKETLTKNVFTTSGYLNSIKALGVTNTNAIMISPTKKVNDVEFLAILEDTITPDSGSFKTDSISTQPDNQTMGKIVELLSFFGSIQLPVNQIDQVLKSIKEFGVTTSNLTDFTSQVADYNLGTYTNFSTFLDKLVKLKVTIKSLPNFTNDLKNFGFTRKNDVQNKMTDYMFFTLDVLIKYDITYEFKYDTRYTKISNCLYNLALDGIKMPLFGDKTNNLAIQLLKKLNRNVDLYSSSNIVPNKKQLNKNMRDLIIRRTDFFYNSSDTTAFGKFYKTTLPLPSTLASFPTNMYQKLFESSSLPSFMYEIDETDSNKLKPLFNGKPILAPPNQTEMEMKRILFYVFVVSQISHPSIGNVPLPFDYCMISNLLTVNEYDQMLRTDGSVLVIRSVMSRLLNKILIKQDESKQKMNAFPKNRKSAIIEYNSYVDVINMISIFPHYSFYLIAKHIRENNPRENDSRKCGDPAYRAHDGTIDPYIVELSKTDTKDPTQYSYMESYEGNSTYDKDSVEIYGFYDRTKPFVSSTQFAVFAE